MAAKNKSLKPAQGGATATPKEAGSLAFPACFGENALWPAGSFSSSAGSMRLTGATYAAFGAWGILPVSGTRACVGPCNCGVNYRAWSGNRPRSLNPNSPRYRLDDDGILGEGNRMFGWKIVLYCLEK